MSGAGMHPVQPHDPPTDSRLTYFPPPQPFPQPTPPPQKGRVLRFLTSAGGILTAIATILTAVVTICGLVLQPWKASDSASQQTEQPSVARSAATTASTTAGGGAVAQVRWTGEVVVSTNESVDLDERPPLRAGLLEKNADIKVGGTTEAPSFDGTVAPMSPEGPVPTEAECAAWIQKHKAASQVYLSRGDRICVQTNEGRTAFLRARSVPNGLGIVQFEVTVWEIPR